MKVVIELEVDTAGFANNGNMRVKSVLDDAADRVDQMLTYKNFGTTSLCVEHVTGCVTVTNT